RPARQMSPGDGIRLPRPAHTENEEGCGAASTSTYLDDTAIAGAWWAADLAGTALIVAFVARPTDGDARSGEDR
ncbi:hypothetical protein, partial [Dietzia cinnamea]|uniref:hypothetical protein n=2 Tax=Dietziaceae TaxID=85029 RepID=UPI00223C2566